MWVGDDSKGHRWLPWGFLCKRHPHYLDHKEEEKERGRERQELTVGQSPGLPTGPCPAQLVSFRLLGPPWPPASFPSHLEKLRCCIPVQAERSRRTFKVWLGLPRSAQEILLSFAHVFPDTSGRPLSSRHRSRSGSASQQPAQGNVAISPGPELAPGLENRHSKQREGLMEGRKESNTQEDPERKNSRIGSEDRNIALSKITIPAHLKKDERLQTVDLKNVGHSGEAEMSAWEQKVRVKCPHSRLMMVLSEGSSQAQPARGGGGRGRSPRP